MFLISKYPYSSIGYKQLKSNLYIFYLKALL